MLRIIANLLCLLLVSAHGLSNVPVSIQYLGHSYDIFTAYPIGNIGFFNDGFQVFETELDRASVETEFPRNEGFTITKVDDCSTAFKCTYLESTKDYREYMATFVTAEPAISTESAFIASSHYQYDVKDTFQNGNVLVVCVAKCLVYKTRLDMENPPKVTPLFRWVLARTRANSCPRFAKSHISKGITSGSMAAIWFRAGNADWESYRSEHPSSFDEDIASIVQWSDGLFGSSLIQDDAVSNLRPGARKLKSILTSDTGNTLGSYYHPTTEQWRNSTLEGRGHDMPIELELMPFEDVVDPRYVPASWNYTDSELAAIKGQTKKCLNQYKETVIERFGSE